MLPEIMRAALWDTQGDISLGQPHVALAALVAEDPTSIRQALVKARFEGVNLAHVGALALATDRPGVAKVLAEAFGIRPEDYLTLGTEGDHKPNAPFLAFCARSRSNLLRRALSWGADCRASWQVPDPETPGQMCTISLMEQAISHLDITLCQELVQGGWKADSLEERTRCMKALWDSAGQIGKYTGYGFGTEEKDLDRLRQLLDLFGPQGACDLEMNYWRIKSEHGGSLGSLMMAAIEPHYTHPTHQGQRLFAPWLLASVETVEDCKNFLWDKAWSHTSERFQLPEWCMKHLTCREAPWAWSVMIMAIASEAHNNDSSGSRVEPRLKRLQPLVDLMSPGSMPTLLSILSCLDEREFCNLSPYRMEAMVKHWPGAAMDEHDKEECNLFLKALSRVHADKQRVLHAGMAASKAAELPLDDELVALYRMHQAQRLHEATPPAAITGARARL